MRKVTNFLLPIISFLFIISISVVFTLNFRPLYYFDMEYLDIEVRSGMEEEDIKQNYDALIDYNFFLNDEELVFPTLTQSEEGRIHFEEVKHIFDFFQYMAVILFIILIPIFIFHAWNHDFVFLKYTGILTFTVPTFLGILIAIMWDKVFVLFHKIAFHNDYWIFDPKTDPVISILPDEFFMHCAILILLCVVLLGGLCFFTYWKIHGKERAKVKGKIKKKK